MSLKLVFVRELPGQTKISRVPNFKLASEVISTLTLSPSGLSLSHIPLPTLTPLSHHLTFDLPCLHQADNKPMFAPPHAGSMEAASARYAARDRFAFPTEVPSSPLQRYIQNACSPENFEPNLALSLEIADLVNAKKGNAPREAAITIVGYINHRNPNVSLLALSLLDICVKNCGYPFHLQISTKEFLNELVRRFPERPPIRTTRTQGRILELIEEWRRTICETSKYKEDLGFVRDMHRLLSYKGYVFPEVKREDAAVLNPSDNLKSADEMEAEERAAQSAKLQELIRRGTPHDLQEANKLMKVMAGYDTRHKTDYRAKAAEEVGKIQQKAKLLEEMLQGYKTGDEIQEGDVFEELANALASAHPKIQRMCEEESEDHEAVAKLFEINDSIHRTIERYKLIKKGDIEGANAIPKGTLGVSGAGVTKGPNDELSLIDFGGMDDVGGSQQQDANAGSAPAAQPKGKGNALEDDLLGLSMGDNDFEGGGISLGSPSPSNGTTAPARSTADIMAQFSQPRTAPQAASNSLFAQQTTIHPSQSSPKPNLNMFQSTSQSISKPATPVPPSLQQFQQQPQPLPQKKADPFAALNTPQRQPSPFQYQQSTSKSPAPPTAPAPSSSAGGAVDLLGIDSAPSAPPARPVSANVDDEWTFTSSLPDQPTDLVVTNSAIKTVFTSSRSSDGSEIVIQSRISNNTDKEIKDLTFQLAVTKVRTPSLPFICSALCR